MSKGGTLAAAAATGGALMFGVAFFFYDYVLKRRVDSYLTQVFRDATYKVDEAEGRAVTRSDDPGFDGMMKEMMILFKKVKNDPKQIYHLFRESMDEFFRGLGVDPDLYASFCKANPAMAIWISKNSANVTFSWVVGGAKILPFKDNTMTIKTCHFREQIGEEGCVKMCQKPVEQYFTERMHAPITISPQPREQGLGCKFCYGECVPENLEW